MILNEISGGRKGKKGPHDDVPDLLGKEGFLGGFGIGALKESGNKFKKNLEKLNENSAGGKKTSVGVKLDLKKVAGGGKKVDKDPAGKGKGR